MDISTRLGDCVTNDDDNIANKNKNNNNNSRISKSSHNMAENTVLSAELKQNESNCNPN